MMRNFTIGFCVGAVTHLLAIAYLGRITSLLVCVIVVFIFFTQKWARKKWFKPPVV